MKKAKELFISAVYIALGCALFSVSVNMFSVPNEIVQGGLTGIAIMLSDMLPFIPVGTAVFVMNIPLFVLGYFRLGHAFILKTVAASAAFTAAIDIGGLFIPAYTGDKMLAGIFCGVFAGAGIALILRAGATTGGTETAALLIRQKKPNFSVGRLILFIDLAVVSASYLVYGKTESVMYAVVTLFVTSRVIELFFTGTGHSRAVLVVSDSAGPIARAVMTALSRGVTVIPAKGGFSGKSKEMLFCVVRASQVSKMKQIILETDKNAFTSVISLGEVWGEGFTDI